MNTCPPSSVLSSSTSWSGPIGLIVESEQNLDEQKQQEKHQQHLDQARQTRRSWARSKRISLGCLEWRANSAIIGRAPRPKSASHRLNIPSTDKSNGHPLAAQSDSNSSVSWAHTECTECAMNGLVMDTVKSSRSSQRTKACSGADALLRRLRMRPMSKNSRAKTPTPVGSEIAGRLASIPVRSSSTPRTNCMSKSFIEWTGTEPKVFPSCSHGSRLNLTTSEASDFPPVTSSQRTESCSTVGLCPNSINCPYTNHVPASMTRSFIPYNSSCSLGTKVPDMSLNSSHQLSAACRMCVCTAGCCQHVRPTNDMRLTAPNELYRPLSQPTCYFLRHDCPSVPDLEDSGARRMMTHFSTLPWPATSTNALDTYTRPELPLNNVSSALDPNHIPNYCPGISSQPTGINSACIPASMLASYPSVPRHGQFAFPSSRTTEALFVSCGDSKPDQPQRKTVPGHMASNGDIWHPGLPLCQGVYEAPGTIYSPRARSTEQPRDSSLYWSSVPPLESVSAATQTQGTDQNQSHHYHPHPHKQHQQLHHQTVTSETTVQANQTRPDSLLSTSSLTTADSSQTDSLPNSSSSRDSALGGNLQQTDLKGMTRNKLTGLNANTVQTRHSTHQSHPSHLHHHHHHHHHHHPQLPLTSTDHRVRHTEESHQVNQSSPASSSTDPTHHCPPNPPPKPTAVIESKLPPTPTRSVPWPSRLTPLPDFTASQKHWPSQKARAERKHSVYVNAAIYPLREQPQPQNGGERTLPVGSTSCTPPTSWTHLLPYRTSTVPQNLSERLKKSETLPNDVWVHSQRPNSNNEQQAQPYSPSATMNTITDQCARQNSTDGIPVGLKSPPPRPPIRTSSQQLAGRTPCVVQSHARRPNPSVNSLEETSQLRKSAESHLSGLLNNEQTVLEDSPILCRYSQLYSLSLKPEPGERPRSHLKNSANHSESPASTRTTNSGTRLESQMQKLRLRTEDLS